MHEAGNLLLRAVQDTPLTTQHVKRERGNSAGPLILFLLVNIFIILPFFLFFFYTLAQIIPTLAVVTNHNAPGYTQVPLADLYSDGPPSYPQASLAPQSTLFSLGLGLRPMLSQLFSLRTRFRSLALFRGLGVFVIITMFEAVIAAFSIYFLPALLAILPQVVLPLLLVQLYALWTHTILTYPSAKSLWQRIPPFMTTLRATGPALAVFLATKALLKFTLQSLYGIRDLRLLGALHPKFLGVMILAGAGIELIAVVPAHVVLTRIQASLLPAGEKVLVSIDEALREDVNSRMSRAVGMREALATFGWANWGRLGLLYSQIFVLVLVGGGVVLSVAFIFYLLIAGMSILT